MKSSVFWDDFSFLLGLFSNPGNGGFSEILVGSHRITWSYISEDRDLHYYNLSMISKNVYIAKLFENSDLIKFISVYF
jgi:hypothetical protein